MNLLDKIDNPDDLKKLEIKDLQPLCNEIRSYIIDVVSKKPGHFGASLGVVELTVALHYVFNSPKDSIIFDVGHQSYTHKILTKRKNRFSTIRQLNGLCGFQNRFESEYDPITTGHSSTSISAALGISIAKKIQNNENQVIAIIGDGALTGGLAFEALNNTGFLNSNILIILNDNNISIDPNVGALSKYLTRFTTSATYNKVKEKAWNFFSVKKMFGIRSAFQKLGLGFKSTISNESSLFEALNIRYFGPIDGHNIRTLVKTLEDLKKIKGPKILHCITKKGKGYEPAERQQTLWHAPGKFDKNTGEILSSNIIALPKYQDVFSETIVELAKLNSKIVVVSPAMISGSGLKKIQMEYPKRVFDVGIAEQHALTFSAGIAIEGLLPFCCIYSSFLQRGYDQIVHDLALQKLNAVLCLDRAGLVGEDGATHHGVFDIAFLRSIPNITIAAPSNGLDLRNLLFTAQCSDKGIFAIRYPRGENCISDWKKNFEEMPIGKGRIVSNGNDIAILTIGKPAIFVKPVIEHFADKGISIAHYDMIFVKPLDHSLLHKVFKKFKKIITVEDGVIAGGFGSAVIEFASENGYTSSVYRLGVSDKFIEHGTLKELYKICGFDSEGIIKTVEHLMS